MGINFKKQNLIADFYAYSFLYSFPLTISKSKNLEQITKVKYKIKQETEEFLIKLKTELLLILEFSIIQEFQNLWTESYLKKKYDNTLNLSPTEYLRFFLSDNLDKKTFNLLLDFDPLSFEFLKDFYIDNEILDGCEITGRTYKNILDSSISPKEFIINTRNLFLILKWNDDFGGKKWFNISEKYLELSNEKDFNKIIILCDQIFDIQHNTNTIFNKIPSYELENSYNWIFNFLEKRKYFKNIWNLEKYCKESLILLRKSLYLFGYGTKQQWIKYNNSLSEILELKFYLNKELDKNKIINNQYFINLQKENSYLKSNNNIFTNNIKKIKENFKKSEIQNIILQENIKEKNKKIYINNIKLNKCLEFNNFLKNKIKNIENSFILTLRDISQKIEFIKIQNSQLSVLVNFLIEKLKRKPFFNRIKSFFIK